MKKKVSSREIADQVLDGALEGAEDLAEVFPKAADALTLLGSAVAGLGRRKSNWQGEIEKALQTRYLRSGGRNRC